MDVMMGGVAAAAFAKVSVAAAAASGPPGWAVLAVTTILGGGAYLYANQKTPEASEGEKSPETNGEKPEASENDNSKETKAKDAQLISYVRENQCDGIIDFNTFKQIMEGVWERNPYDRLLLEKNYQDCLDRDSIWNKIGKIVRKTGKVAVAVVATGGTAKAAHELYEYGKSSSTTQKNQDAYVLQKLENNQCEDVCDVKKFKALVEGCFRRNPERAVFLAGNYQRCLKQVERKSHA